MTSIDNDPALPGADTDLRSKAEKAVIEKQAQLPEMPGTPVPGQTQKLLHELRVHQVELEMQNEELRRTQRLLQASQARFLDLYNKAPVGYLTLDENGVVLMANLTAAELLGGDSGDISGQPLTRFILPEDQDIYYLHRKQLEKRGVQECELRLLRAATAPFWARLDSSVVRSDGGRPECPRPEIYSGECAEDAQAPGHGDKCIPHRPG